MEAVENFFEKSFVGEGGKIVIGLQFVHQRERDTPGHPDALTVG